MEAGRIFCFDTFPVNNQIKIGVVPKSNNRFRLIRHGTYPRDGVSVNSLIPKYCASVKLPGFKFVCKLAQKIGKNGWMGKDDLTGAYRQFPTNPSEWPYHTYKHRGRTLIDTRTADGIRSSGSPCQHFGEAIIYIVNKRLPEELRGYIFNYIDDFVYGHQDYEKCILIRDTLRSVFKEARIDFSLEKEVIPAQKVVVIGYSVNFIEYVLQLSEKRKEKWLKLLINTINSKHKTYNELESLIGKLEFGSPVAWPLRAFISNIREALPKHRDKNALIPITNSIKSDLYIWIQFLNVMNGVNIDDLINEPKNTANFTADASDIGFGAFYPPHWIHGEWDWYESDKYIAWREMYIILASFVAFGPLWINKRVVIITDNDTVYRIIKKRYSPRSELMFFVKEIALFCMLNNCKYWVSKISSKNNIFSDALSRNQFDKFQMSCKKYNLQYNATPTHFKRLIYPRSDCIEPIYSDYNNISNVGKL